ncbi:MAG TPA: class I SAM-dependent methyltransferase [Geothermobacteraceae bacterium]|nr:class I SAM-dependent methyltransferase [Geothermobacteraceae bacterium]
MSFYSHLMARVYDAALGRMEAACLGAWRAELLSQASGAVLEIGAGTGANLLHYPPGISCLTLAEPDPHMRRRLQGKLSALAVETYQVVANAVDDLDFPDHSFDSIVSTLVLCSVASQVTALARIKSLLKPDGQLLFLEHVAAKDRPGLLRWQKLLQPVWRPLCGNCHLARDTERAIRAAGFSIKSIQYLVSSGSPAFASPTIMGIAAPL